MQHVSVRLQCSAVLSARAYQQPVQISCVDVDLICFIFFSSLFGGADRGHAHRGLSTFKVRSTSTKYTMSYFCMGCRHLLFDYPFDNSSTLHSAPTKSCVCVPIILPLCACVQLLVSCGPTHFPGHRTVRHQRIGSQFHSLFSPLSLSLSLPLSLPLSFEKELMVEGHTRPRVHNCIRTRIWRRSCIVHIPPSVSNRPEICRPVSSLYTKIKCRVIIPRSIFILF